MPKHRHPKTFSPLNLRGGNGVIYWGFIGIMEKKMETTILGLYRG